MSLPSAEILYDVLAFHNRLSLAKLSLVSKQLNGIINKHLSSSPFHNIGYFGAGPGLECTIKSEKKVSIQEATAKLQSKVLCSKMVEIALPEEDKEAIALIEALRPLSHLWSRQCLYLNFSGPLSPNVLEQLFTDFVASASELTLTSYTPIMINLAYPDLINSKNLWIHEKIVCFAKVILQYLLHEKGNNRLSMARNLRNEDNVDQIIDFIAKDFRQAKEPCSFEFNAEFSLCHTSDESNKREVVENETTNENLVIIKEGRGYGSVFLNIQRIVKNASCKYSD